MFSKEYISAPCDTMRLTIYVSYFTEDKSLDALNRLKLAVTFPATCFDIEKSLSFVHRVCV
jgi:hypothetical protein